MNKVKIAIDINDLTINISKASIDDILSLIIGIIVSVNKKKEKISLLENKNLINLDSKNPPSFLKENKNYNEKKICIEQILLKKIDSEIKKLEIKIQNIKVNIYNNNYIYKYLTMFINNLKIERNSKLFLENDINGDLHLIKRETEFHLFEIKIFEFKNKKLSPVTEVPNFDLSIKDNIIYHSITQMATLLTNINGKLSNIELILSPKNVNKIIEIVLTIVDGIDIIEYVIKAKNNSKYRIDREMKDKTLIEIDLENINVYLYSQDYFTNIIDIGMKIRMENIKGISKMMNLDFSRINLCFSPNLKDNSLTNILTSNFIVDGFKLIINDKKANGGERWYNLYFEHTFIVTSDRHILDIIKFVSEFADFILRDDIDKKFQKKPGKYGVVLKKFAKKETKLTMNKTEAVILIHENDSYPR